jgi:L-malate glycosyltransferase
MHILIIPSWYKEYKGHVLGSFFEEQARALLKNGNKVGMIYQVFIPASDFFKPIQKQPGYFDDRGINTYIFNNRSIIPHFKALNLWYINIRSELIYRKYVRRFGKPDIIHAHSVFHAGIIGAHISKKYNIPLVITEHLTHYMTGSLSQDFDIPVAIKTFKYSNANLVVGNVFKKELVKALNMNESAFKVVYNMVADLFFENVQVKSYDKEKEEFIFFTNSFLNPRKNHPLIFDALKTLLNKGYKVKLVVGGFGMTEQALKAYVLNQGLTQHVEFTGELSRLQVKEQLDKCHAFVLASKYETFGVVLIESLACGRPVISTDSGGPRDIVKPENGLLSKSFEVNDFAAAMEQIIVNYNLYNQLQISKDCYATFSEDTIVEQLMKIYLEEIARRASKIKSQLPL